MTGTCRYFGGFVAAVLLSSACKTTTPAKPASEALAAANAAPACPETCAGTFAPAAVAGCVVGCSQWLSKTLKVKEATSLYPGLAASPHCSFTYEQRAGSLKQRGLNTQLFSFGFRLTDGVGDGGFLITSSGMVEPHLLIDFHRAYDQKVFSHDGGSTTLTFLRSDPHQEGAPSFQIEEVDTAESEAKTLRLSLGQQFDAQAPFAQVTLARFTAKKAAAGVTDIACTP